jgi:uncharacterized protein DUF4129
VANQPRTRNSPKGTEYSVLSSQYPVLLLRAAIATAIATLLLTRSLIAAAAEPPPNDPVKAGKEALSSGGKFPWYDRRQDDVRRLTVVPRPSTEERGDKWTDNKARASKTMKMPRISLFGNLLQWIGLTTLIVLLGIIAYLIATSFLKEEVSEEVAVRKVVESRRDADRVEALPFHIRAARGDFLAEARRLYEAGQYSEAIVYLFSYELVQLDKHHVIRLAKGKTNRQYVRETRQRPPLAIVLQTTMIAFEDAFFGRKALSREAFERCWQRLDEFQGELAREELAAA